LFFKMMADLVHTNGFGSRCDAGGSRDRGLQLIDGAATRGGTLLNEMRFRQAKGSGHFMPQAGCRQSPISE
jgi:hypothetical protein